MRMRASRLAPFFVALLAHASAAAAPMSKEQCIDANVRAQDARRDLHFAEAAEALRACLDPSCPSTLRDDCAERLDELQKAMPTIVFTAKDGDGRDLSDVAVTIDGKPLLAKLDGRAVFVDPGEHVLGFRTSSGQTFEKKIVVIEGEKARRESVVIGAPSTPPAPARADAPAPLPVRPAPGSPRRTSGLVLGGVGLIGLGLGSYFGLRASSRWSESEAACSTTSCPDHAGAVASHGSAVRFASVSTVSFVTGGAFLLAGALLFLTAPSAADQATTSARVRVAPAVSGEGAGMFAIGVF